MNNPQLIAAISLLSLCLILLIIFRHNNGEQPSQIERTDVDPLPSEGDCIELAHRIVAEQHLTPTNLYRCAQQFLSAVENVETAKIYRLRPLLLQALTYHREIHGALTGE